jgi:hypothetical protein
MRGLRPPVVVTLASAGFNPELLTERGLPDHPGRVGRVPELDISDIPS